MDLLDKDSVHARFENIPRQGGDLFLKVDDDAALYASSDLHLSGHWVQSLSREAAGV